MFVAPERKTSTVKGTGVQYIPGHVDPFVDHVLSAYLNVSDRMLDLGGGGLRFAIPAAIAGKSLTVIDLDSSAMNVDLIVDRVNKVGKLNLDSQAIKPLITTIECDVISYLKKAAIYDLITSFRFVHFLDLNQLTQFFKYTSRCLELGGRLAISGLALSKDSESKNAIYELTEPVYEDDLMYRKWNEGDQARRVQKEQNLGPFVHFLNEDYVNRLAGNFGYQLIECDIYSTNVVRGYVLEKASIGYV